MMSPGQHYPVVEKPRAATGVAPNLADYDNARREFSWVAARRELDGLPGGAGLNMAYEAVDRHLVHGRGEQLALRWLGKNGEMLDVSYRDLSEQTARFANVLRSLGVRKGERVFALLPRIPQLYVACLGTIKHGSVFSTLFSAFGPEPIALRLQLGAAKVLVTTAALYRKKIEALRASLPALEHVLIVGSREAIPPRTLDASGLLGRASPLFEIPPTDPEDPALLHFTSGTTGRPKAAVHVHGAIIAHHITGKLALDLHASDVFWCTADPGWVTGTSYGILSPLTNGVTSIVDEGEFDAERWYGILARERVSVWYTAPTAVRMMMRGGNDVARGFDTRALRFIASVGEPLNPEAVLWGQRAFGLPIHDNWWQTETGGIMIANFASLPIRPGSMGKPLPGIEAGIVRRDEGGHLQVIEEPDVQGELALRRGWP